MGKANSCETSLLTFATCSVFDDVSICSTHVYLLECDKTDLFSACQPASVWPSATALDGKQKEQTKKTVKKEEKEEEEKEEEEEKKIGVGGSRGWGARGRGCLCNLWTSVGHNGVGGGQCSSNTPHPPTPSDLYGYFTAGM